MLLNMQTKINYSLIIEIKEVINQPLYLHNMHACTHLIHNFCT